jgi:hypothetical protein
MEAATEEEINTTARLLGKDSGEIKLCEEIVRLEWEQFQDVDNEGGPADCQGNWPTFHQMRLSQFATWPVELLKSYQDDLLRAPHEGRNLLTEKYAWMMQSTAPEYFEENLESHLPALSSERIDLQEEIIAIQVDWARAFMEQYPMLGANMRILTTSQDTKDSTSFETYLRGELSSYSTRTVELYAKWVRERRAQSCNVTTETLLNTVLLGGFSGLDDAEEYLQK